MKRGSGRWKALANVNIGSMVMSDVPRKFLCSISPQGDYVFYALTASQVADANFLDIKNLKLENASHESIPIRAYAGQEQGWPLRYIFHTAFCGSTLLSRALSELPRIMVLKEPDVLMKVSGGSLHSGNESVIPYLMTSLKELSQPWTESGAVVIKPTNSVNRLVPEIMANYPGKTILLYGGLEDFLVSCIKKLPAAEEKIRWMAQHLLHQTDLQKKLGVDTYYKFNFVESCVITWYSQMEYFAKAIERDHLDQIRMLDMKDMLAKPFETVRAASHFFELQKSDAEIEVSVAREFSRNSKKVETAYTDAERSQEASRVRAQYSDLLRIALEWAANNIAPAAIMPGNYKSLV